MPQKKLTVIIEKLQALHEYIKLMGAGKAENNTLYRKSDSKLIQEKSPKNAQQKKLQPILDWDYFSNELEFE